MTSSHAAVWRHSTRWAAFEATRALDSAADDDISTHRRAVYNGSDLDDLLRSDDEVDEFVPGIAVPSAWPQRTGKANREEDEPCWDRRRHCFNGSELCFDDDLLRSENDDFVVPEDGALSSAWLQHAAEASRAEDQPCLDRRRRRCFDGSELYLGDLDSGKDADEGGRRRTAWGSSAITRQDADDHFVRFRGALQIISSSTPTATTKKERQLAGSCAIVEELRASSCCCHLAAAAAFPPVPAPPLPQDRRTWNAVYQFPIIMMGRATSFRSGGTYELTGFCRGAYRYRGRGSWQVATSQQQIALLASSSLRLHILNDLDCFFCVRGLFGQLSWVLCVCLCAFDDQTQQLNK